MYRGMGGGPEGVGPLSDQLCPQGKQVMRNFVAA